MAGQAETPHNSEAGQSILTLQMKINMDHSLTSHSAVESRWDDELRADQARSTPAPFSDA